MTAIVAIGWAGLVLWATYRWLASPARRPEPTVVGGASRPSRQRQRPRQRPRLRQRAVRGIAVAALLVVISWTIAPFAAAAAVGVVLLARRARALRAVRWRAALVDDAAPEVVELIRLAVTSGLTPYLALGEVAPLAPPPFDDELTVVLTDVRRGQRLADALAAMAERVGPSARPLCAALVATERYGVALLPALDGAAVELRRARRVTIEARARRLPVLLSFPLVCCVLPAFALLALAPVVAGAVRSLHQPPASSSAASSAMRSRSASEPVPGASHPRLTTTTATSAVYAGGIRP